MPATWVGMVRNLIVAVTVGGFTAAPPTAVQETVETIRFPEGAGGTAEQH